MKFSLLAATVAALSLTTSFAGAMQVALDTKPTPATAGSPSSCADDMGHLRFIRAAEIAPGTYVKVFIQPVCEGENIGSLRSDGNAGPLRDTIAHDPVMTAALDDKSYAPSNVVGVLMGGGKTIILYVHKG